MQEVAAIVIEAPNRRVADLEIEGASRKGAAVVFIKPYAAAEWVKPAADTSDAGGSSHRHWSAEPTGGQIWRLKAPSRKGAAFVFQAICCGRVGETSSGHQRCRR